MIWPIAMYEYMLTREREKRRRKSIPEELEYVEMLQ